MARPAGASKFHVFPRPNTNIWWVWYWIDASGIRKRKRISTADLVTGPLTHTDYTQDQAQVAVDQATGVKRRNDPVRNLSVKWALEYMEERVTAEGKKKSTWSHYRSALLMFQEVYGESYNLEKFTRKDVWEFQHTCLKAEKSPVTVNTYCRGMAAIYHRMLKSGLVSVNPFAEFERLREPEKKRHLTKEELKEFLKAVAAYSNKDMARLLEILVFTGMRRSEVLNISRSDVDLDGNRFMVTNVKSRNIRRRWLSIPPKVRPHFDYFLTRDGEYPFRICRPDTLGRVARKCMENAKLPFHTHSLRHTFATLALLGGTSLRQVQRILDHSDLAITERYAHDASESYQTPDIGL